MGLDDSFILPDKTSVACKGIGNGVCPPVTEALARATA